MRPGHQEKQWQLAYLAEYTADICHVAGIKNVIEDAQSRPPGQLPSLSELAEEGGSTGACFFPPAPAVSSLPRPPGQLPSLPSAAEKGGSAGACSSSPAVVSSLLPVQSTPRGLSDLAAITAEQIN